MSKLQAEQTALNMLNYVLKHHHNLTDAFAHYNVEQLAPAPRAYAKQLCFGVMRYYVRLETIAQHIMQKPIRQKDFILNVILYLGLYQLLYGRMPQHAVVNHCVELTRVVKKPFASRFINACLRQFLREQKNILAQVDQIPAQQYACPTWLYDSLQQAWPEQLSNILHGQNQQAPLSLCVNQQQITRDDYLKLLTEHNIEATACEFSADGVTLAQAQAITNLPGFAQGYFFVQDQAPQLATQLLQLADGQQILDACAAPGGKTAHLLSQGKTIKLFAVDHDDKRLQRLRENLQRLQLHCDTYIADLTQAQTWLQPNTFDRILYDAPCSATGVIRRHPDIKYLRQANDITQLTQQQLTILNNLWPSLKPNGRLLYATCSILPQENSQIIQQFLHQHADASEIKLNTPWGHPQKFGCQIFPGEHNMDGFYYCCLIKQP